MSTDPIRARLDRDERWVTREMYVDAHCLIGALRAVLDLCDDPPRSTGRVVFTEDIRRVIARELDIE